ncbi:MAG: transglutaminase-like domain-containing protein, partial [Spirochaetota bacterium]
DRQAIGSLPPSREGRILLRLSLLMDYFPLLPQILDATTVVPNRSGDGLLFEGGPATGLALARPLLSGERLLVVTGMEPVVGSGPMQDSIDGSVPQYDASNDPGFYLAIPADLSPVVRDLAASLSGLSGSELPAALTHLLDEGFTYSLDPSDRPGNDNQQREETPESGNQSESGEFLQHFLSESRTGYCVHFASAAVLLARLAGTPARYVTGFLVSIPQPEDDFLQSGSGGLVRTEITGLNSHAWVELWLPSTGWTSFEATPPMRQPAAGDVRSGATSMSLDDFTLRQLAAITGGRVDLRDPGVHGPGGAITPARLAIGTLAFALVALVGVGLYRKAIQSGWRPGDQAGRWLGTCTGWRDGSPGLAHFRRKARRVVRLATDWGVPGPERSGWLAWEEGVAALLARHGANLNAPSLTPFLTFRKLGVYREVFFGCRPPESQDFVHSDRLASYLRGLSKRHPAGFPVGGSSAQYLPDEAGAGQDTRKGRS